MYYDFSVHSIIHLYRWAYKLITVRVLLMHNLNKSFQHHNNLN